MTTLEQMKEQFIKIAERLIQKQMLLGMMISEDLDWATAPILRQTEAAIRILEDQYDILETAIVLHEVRTTYNPVLDTVTAA